MDHFTPILRNIPKLHYLGHACQVKSEVGFNVQHLFAVIQYVNSLSDCLLLCRKKPECSSVNYIRGVRSFVTTADTDGLCFFSASTVRDFNSLHSIDGSTYATFSCPEDPDKSRYIPSSISHGAYPRYCGIIPFNHPPPQSPAFFNKRVVGGYDAYPYAQPWLGHVIHSQTSVCGISLISNSMHDATTLFGISAAHCFCGPDNEMQLKSSFGFIFGGHDLRFPSAHTVHRVAKEIIIHTGYNENLKNDIALVKFDKRIRFNGFVRPICLPQASEWVNADLELATSCSICGYGAESTDNVFDRSNTPKCIPIQFLQPGVLIEELSFQIPGAYCLASAVDQMEYKGIREGDSGAPVACLMNNKFTIIAVASSIIFPDSSVYASNIYIRVSYYLNWIQSTITVLTKGAPFTGL